MVTRRQLPDFDVVIAGGGPAGAAAAVSLAKAGFAVAVLDQKSFPRDKVCGDFVGPAAVAELEFLGVTDRPEFWNTNEIHSAALYLDGEKLIERLFPQVEGLPVFGRVIPRIDLDDWIVKAAVDAGAELRESHRVTGYELTDGAICVRVKGKSGPQVITARLLIGADGSSSVVARQLVGRRQDDQHCITAVRAYYEGVAQVSDRAELFFTADSFPGYCWLFPTGVDTANVGVGMALGTVPKNHTKLRELLKNLVECDPVLRRRLCGAAIIGKIVGWPLASYDPSMPLISDHVMLVGDAAGLINPLNGEGIQTALCSARWASEIAIPCLTGNALSARSLAPYQRRIEDGLRHDMALACLLIQLIRNRALAPVWLEALRIICRRAKRDEDYAHLAGGILAGIVPTSHAVSIRMVLGSVQEAALLLGTGGVSALSSAARCDPRWFGQFGLDVTRTGFQLLYDAASNPDDMIRWGASTARLAAELALQSLRSGTRLAGNHTHRLVHGRSQ